MRVVSVELRNFRSYDRAQVILGSGLTVVSGRNGAGKTNLLEAIYFGSMGRSFRTNNDREVVMFGTRATRVAVALDSEEGTHTLSVGITPGELKRMAVDGGVVDRLLDHPSRPLMSVFLPERLELIKGAPALRRAHVDQLVAALWPTRISTRRGYNQALAQRNALLLRLRSGAGSRRSLHAWDEQVASHALALMQDRAEAIERIGPEFVEMCTRLGLEGEMSLRYRTRSSAESVERFLAELHEKLDSDIERGFTGHGPHRDDIIVAQDGREVRTYGSQGQQRVSLLALLLAERTVIGMERSMPPVLLLDDVMSELDRSRREALVELVSEHPGQVVITTTDVEHVPESDQRDTTNLVVQTGGRVVAFAGPRGRYDAP